MPGFLVRAMLLLVFAGSIFGSGSVRSQERTEVDIELVLAVDVSYSMAFLNERVSDALRATISGGYFLAWGLGYFLGPLLVGWSDAVGHPQTGFLVLSGLMVLQALLLCRAGAGRT